MAFVGVLLALIVGCQILLLLLRKRNRRLPFPPGPRGWPVVGSLLSLGPLPHRSLHALSQRYGPIMFLDLGSRPTLVISSPEMAEKVLKTKDNVMASRPHGAAAKGLLYNGAGLTFVPYGDFWRRTRKICAQEILSAQRVQQFQPTRHREMLATVQAILEDSQRRSGEVTLSSFLSSLATNNVTQMMLAKSYCSMVAADNIADAEDTTFRGVVKEMVTLLGEFNVADFIPVMGRLDLQGFNKRLQAAHERLDTFLEGVLAQHRLLRSGDELSCTSRRNFLDVLLAAVEGDHDNEKEEVTLTLDTVKCLLTEMILAGTDTISITLEWALTELVRHPTVLASAQEELDAVVGPHRLVNEADIPALKLIQAIVKEVLRLHPATPLLLPRECTQDCEISGFHVPAGTRVLINAWALQRDPQAWERPLEFDPGRFLHGCCMADVKGRNFELVPFGSGRRICPGMHLGLLMVQVGLAQLLHTLTWALPEGVRPEDVNLSEIFGLTSPKAVPLTVSVAPRLPVHVLFPEGF